MRYGLTASFIVALVLSLLWVSPDAKAQHPPVPVVGHLKTRGPSNSDAAFLQGLSETGYSEGRNVMLERRSAEGHYERLPALASELADGFAVPTVRLDNGNFTSGARHRAEGGTT